MNEGKMKSLENLEPAKLEWLMHIVSRSRLIDCVDALKELGISVSLPTLSRFVQRHRQKVLLESGEDMIEAAETLRARGKQTAFREGTLEALRQRLFEKALNETTADEELRTMYLDLVKEEAKLKELELAERRVAVGEEHARLARMRTRMELQDRPRKKVELEAVEDVSGGTEVKQLAEASEIPKGDGKKEFLVMLHITAGIPAQRNANSAWMFEVSVTSFPASVLEASPFQVPDQFAHFPRHLVSKRYWNSAFASTFFFPLCAFAVSASLR